MITPNRRSRVPIPSSEQIDSPLRHVRRSIDQSTDDPLQRRNKRPERKRSTIDPLGAKRSSRPLRARDQRAPPRVWIDQSSRSPRSAEPSESLDRPKQSVPLERRAQRSLERSADRSPPEPPPSPVHCTHCFCGGTISTHLRRLHGGDSPTYATSKGWHEPTPRLATPPDTPTWLVTKFRV
jgi:hypothetical protein